LLKEESHAPEAGVFLFGQGDREPHFSSEMGHVPVRIRKIDFFEVKK